MIKKILTFILSQCVMSVAIAANYLTFTAEEAGSKFGILNSEDNDPDVQYSLDDGATWTVLKPGDRVELKNVGDKAFLKGNNPDGFSTAYEHNSEYFYDYTEFRMSGKIAASGSVMSLVDGEGSSDKIPSNGCFYRLFKTCTALTKAPELPATTLRNQCYQEMFYDCTSLTKAPKLPATKLFPGCYMFMFYFCENLTEAPELPATEFFEEYSGDASRFVPCYGGMFGKCRSLKEITVDFRDWGESYEVIEGDLDSNTDGWVTDVASSGCFFCHRPLPIEYGVDRIPKGWVVKYIGDSDDCVDPCTYTTEYSGGVSYTENGVVEVLDNGYTAEIGTFTSAAKAETTTVFGGKADCAFKSSWNIGFDDDFLAGVGYHDSLASKEYTDLGDIYAVYNYTKSGTAGNYSYIGVHGWMKNPLIEYFIVDDVFDPSAGGLFLGCFQRGKYTVDGVEYILMVGQRLATPSIEGTANYQQIFAVRSSYRTCGTINVTDHFRKWENLGMEFGNIYDCKILCNLSGGEGYIEYTCASMTWNGKKSSLGDLSCDMTYNGEHTDVNDAVSSEMTVWTEGNTIYVRGAEEDVTLYDVYGRLISTSAAKADEIHMFNVPAKGVYLVEINGSTITTLVK